MSEIEVLKHVRFVVDAQGHPTAALLDMELWRHVVELLEDAEDLEIAESALARLKAAGGDPIKAGWLELDKVKTELDGGL